MSQDTQTSDSEAEEVEKKIVQATGYKIKLLARCPSCSWYRMVSNLPEVQTKIYYHPAYGQVTVLTAAELDVRHHKCSLHDLALAKLGKY